MGNGMRQVIIVLSGILLFISSCMIMEPGLDKAKFAELNRAAQDMKTALRSGKNCEVSDTLVQRLASGTAALKDKTASKADRDLLAAYSRLLAIYRDGLLLCQSRTHLTNFEFVPRGRIYVTQELDPIVERYDLRVEMHVYRPTGAYWKSIPGDSILAIWKTAEAAIKNIENMVKYN
jgi:hypothetical protein